MTKDAGSAGKGETPPDDAEGLGANASIDAPRLTPQGRTSPDPSGTDATSPTGEGATRGQPDGAEG